MSEYIAVTGNATNISGIRFGKLTPLGPIRKSAGGHIIWLCQCDCGSTTEARACHLKSGHTQSCGCSGSRTSAAERFSTHGLGKSREYKSWAHIVRRCTNPNNPAFADYGGRGITVCDEWRHNFQTFYDHVSVLPHSGEKGYSIDRIFNNGNYEPGNVKWSTAKEQSRNTRANVMLTHNDKIQCVADWAKELDIPSAVLHKRLLRGWSAQKTLATPRGASKNANV